MAQYEVLDTDCILLPGYRPIRDGVVVTVVQPYSRLDARSSMLAPWLLPALGLSVSIACIGASWALILASFLLVSLIWYGWDSIRRIRSAVVPEYVLNTLTLPFTTQHDPEVVRWLGDRYMHHQTFNRAVVQAIHKLALTADADIRYDLLHNGDSLVGQVEAARISVDDSLVSTVADAEAAGTWQVGMAVTVAKANKGGLGLPDGIASPVRNSDEGDNNDQS